MPDWGGGTKPLTSNREAGVEGRNCYFIMVVGEDIAGKMSLSRDLKEMSQRHKKHEREPCWYLGDNYSRQ